MRLKSKKKTNYWNITKIMGWEDKEKKQMRLRTLEILYSKINKRQMNWNRSIIWNLNFPSFILNKDLQILDQFEQSQWRSQTSSQTILSITTQSYLLEARETKIWIFQTLMRAKQSPTENEGWDWERKKGRNECQIWQAMKVWFIKVIME